MGVFHHLFSWTSCMFSIPMALLRLELNGPDFFLVGLFPGIIKDCQQERKEGRVKNAFTDTQLYFIRFKRKMQFKNMATQIFRLIFNTAPFQVLERCGKKLKYGFRSLMTSRGDSLCVRAEHTKARDKRGFKAAQPATKYAFSAAALFLQPPF